MKIGITCYPTYGGSGAVATELGIALAERGHEIHRRGALHAANHSQHFHFVLDAQTVARFDLDRRGPVRRKMPAMPHIALPRRMVAVRACG